MTNIVANILTNNFSVAKEGILAKIASLLENKLDGIKKQLAFETYGELTEYLQGNVQKMGRTKMVRVRVRQGKVQRRKKIATQPGYTVRNGKIIRMTAQERRNRRLAARKAKIKRRSKKSQMLRKRRLSLRKRLSMGIK